MFKNYIIFDFSFGQYFSDQEELKCQVEQHIVDLHKCIKRMQPLIDSGCVAVEFGAFDYIKRNIFFFGEAAVLTLGRMRKKSNPELQIAASYFLELLNKASADVGGSVIVTSNQKQEGGNAFDCMVNLDLAEGKDVFSIGKGGEVLSHAIRITSVEQGRFLELNHARTMGMQNQFFPTYKHNDGKHGDDEWYRGGGKIVSTMDLSEEEAELLMLKGIYFEDSKRFISYHTVKKAFYTFPCSSHDMNYHGYKGKPSGGVSEAEFERVKRKCSE